MVLRDSSAKSTVFCVFSFSVQTIEAFTHPLESQFVTFHIESDHILDCIQTTLNDKVINPAFSREKCYLSLLINLFCDNMGDP